MQEELPAYVSGRLDGAERRQVEAWLASDAEHADLVADWKRIAFGLREGGASLLEPCPDAHQLLAWTRGERTDPTGGIARHLETCASCGLEVRAARRNRPRSSGNAPHRARRAVIYRFASLAAAAGIVLGVGLGMLLDAPGTVLPEALGPVDLLQLDPSLRGQENPLVFGVDRAQPYVPIVIMPVLPDDARGEDRFRFSLFVAGGGEVWSSELTAAAIESRLAVSGILTFLVPAGDLPTGSYTLHVVRAASPGEPPLLRVPFVIE